MRFDERNRNRLLGALTLAAVAGIVAPLLLDGDGVPEIAAHGFAPLPADPVPVDAAPLATEGPDWAFIDEAARLEAAAGFGPEVDGVATRLGQPRGEDVPDPPATAVDQPAAAAAPGGAMAAEEPWVVQVAAFEQRDNARRLKDRLMADGFHAFVTDVRLAGGREGARVAVGPILDPAEARRLRDELARRYDVDAVLKRFAL